ncbi:hypothetical protein GW17_00044981 [Ensete ventricosum]|nr:hypothetical protein GW17_00044981 [Ensete ventricosum]
MASWVPLGARSSFSQKDVLALSLPPSVPPPYAGAAPASGRPCQRSPLRAIALAAGLPLAALQRATATCGLAAGAAYARRCRPYRPRPSSRAIAPAGGCPLRVCCPCKGALAVVGRPLIGGLGYSQIRMEKMKEVKRPPFYPYPHDGSLQ